MVLGSDSVILKRSDEGGNYVELFGELVMRVPQYGQMTAVRWVEGSVIDKNDIRSAPVELWIYLEPELPASVFPIKDSREVATKSGHFQ